MRVLTWNVVVKRLVFDFFKHILELNSVHFFIYPMFQNSAPCLNVMIRVVMRAQRLGAPTARQSDQLENPKRTTNDVDEKAG